jgi:hypothetical protein
LACIAHRGQNGSESAASPDKSRQSWSKYLDVMDILFSMRRKTWEPVHGGFEVVS